MGIRPGQNYSNYHNGEDDTCLKPKQSSNFRWSSETEMFPHRSTLDQLQLVHCVIFNIISKNDTEYQPGLEPNWTAASSTVRFVAVILKLSPRPVEPVFFHQPHLDLTGLSPNSPFGPIIHDRRGGHYGIKGKAWNPKEAITLPFNCVSVKCQSTPDVWESSASL